ncbi:MAG: ABC transporter substrate-binding protein [Burkholderiaceae bacterium]
MRRFLLKGLAAAPFAALPVAARAQTSPGWDAVLKTARGGKVFWNAWAGDERTNAFIAWTAEQVRARYGITVQHVRLKDTSEAVTRVIAEKTAGRDADGSVDLVWINGPNFLNLKQAGLLYGPFAERLPNWRYVDTVNKRSNVIDFTTPVQGYAAPWRMAQIVFVYDAKRLKDPAALPRSAPALLEWSRRNPGRLTHPGVRNFLGSTFLKQALCELVADVSVLQQPATDASFATVTAPLWPWYDALRPTLWRQGRQFPESGPAQRQLLNDGEIDVMISFNPSEAAVAITNGLLPDSVRTFTFTRGTIGNTSFVAIPYNAPNKDAAMVVADFLLEPATQAHAQDIKQMGNQNVLDLARLSPADRARFDALTPSPALPTAADLARPLLEPHASWMTRIVTEWERRYTT